MFGFSTKSTIIPNLFFFTTPYEDGSSTFFTKIAPSSLSKSWKFIAFSKKKRVSENIRVVFGHWSQLGLKVMPKIICTDTSCAWGGKLTAVRLDSKIPKVTQVCS